MPETRPKTPSPPPLLKEGPEDEASNRQEKADQEEIPAEVTPVGPIGRQPELADVLGRLAADALDHDVGVGTALDRLHRAVDQPEADQLGESQAFAFRRKPVKPIAFAADHQAFEPKGRVDGELAALLDGFG